MCLLSVHLNSVAFKVQVSPYPPVASGIIGTLGYHWQLLDNNVWLSSCVHVHRPCQVCAILFGDNLSCAMVLKRKATMKSDVMT